MRYFRAFYVVDTEERDTNLRSLPALYTSFDDKVFALPYHHMGWEEKGQANFAVSLIFKDSGVSEGTAQDRMNDAMQLWSIDDISHQTRFEECTIEEIFMDCMSRRFSNCSFEEDQIKRLLNLNGTCSFITSSRFGMKESVVEPFDAPEKLFELTADTPYASNLAAELERVFAIQETADGGMVPHAPITYLVEGNAFSDADEAIKILVGALHASGRIGSGHVFTINVDDHDRWLRQDSDYRSYINHQLIRAIEGNTLVIRYGIFDSATGYDIDSYKLLTSLLDLMEHAAVGTQLILSVPENNPDLVARLRKRYDKPIMLIMKDQGTAMSKGSFERNLETMERMAADRGVKSDESMATLLLKRMRAARDTELESVFEEWLAYHNACLTYPQYAAVIREAIDQGITDDEVSAQVRLDGLIGLDHVKEHIRNIIMRIEMNKCLVEKGLPERHFSMHMTFVGAPGTGKTEVARLYAEILKDKGVLSEGRLITVSGGGGFKVKETFEKAKGSVLFIDEAYGLLNHSGMITELIAQMENNRADTVVILAGYEGHMNALIASNPGFRSRIGFTIKFPDYSCDELRSIFTYMCEGQQLILSAGVEEAVRDIVERGGRRADHGNARFVRKLFEDSVGGQQVRLAKQMKEDPDALVSLEDLRTLTVKDVEQAKSSLGLKEDDGMTAREKLDGLIGLEPIKKLVNARMDFARVQKVKRDADLKVPFIPMHMAFKGNPGTGKTEVARLIGRILHEEGVLSVGEFFECSKKDLVFAGSGMSSEAVATLFQAARGSVIFIDEAYTLLEPHKGGSGDEAITAILDQMEKLRDEVVVIFAGYTKEIEDLLDSNPGFASRVKAQLEFPDYTVDELVSILHHMVEDQGFKLAEGVDDKVSKIVERAMGEDGFGNARFIRSLLEDAQVAQSVRLASGKKALEGLSVDELTLLLPEDFVWEGLAKARSIGFAA